MNASKQNAGMMSSTWGEIGHSGNNSSRDGEAPHSNFEKNSSKPVSAMGY